jgi:hypothetical protein
MRDSLLRRLVRLPDMHIHAFVMEICLFPMYDSRIYHNMDNNAFSNVNSSYYSADRADALYSLVLRYSILQDGNSERCMQASSTEI